MESLYECLSPEGSPVADRGGKDGGKGRKMVPVQIL